MEKKQIIGNIKKSLEESLEFSFLNLYDDSYLHSKHNSASLLELTHLRIEYNLAKEAKVLVQEQRDLSKIIYSICPNIHSISFKRLNKI